MILYAKIMEKNKKYSSLKCVSPIGHTLKVVSEVLSIDDRDFFVKSSPIFDEKGKYWGCVEVFRDVTEQNKLQEKILSYNKKTKEDMETASDIQKTFLEKLNHISGIDIEYKYISSEELSGDFFEMLQNKISYKKRF